MRVKKSNLNNVGGKYSKVGQGSGVLDKEQILEYPEGIYVGMGLQ